jgi:hypothetical protein
MPDAVLPFDRESRETASSPTPISSLFKENMGTCHWAACRAVVP